MQERKILIHCVKWADCCACQHGSSAFLDKEPYRVFGRGNPNANVLIVGEGPGGDEIKCGRPFIGRAGVLLNEILHYAGIPMWDCYITNSMICSPDGHVKPTARTILECRPRVRELIGIIKPKLIITLGAYAYESVMNQRPLTLGSVLGKKMGLGSIVVRAEYHPAFLLRCPDAKKEAAPRWKQIGELYVSLIS